MPRPDPLAALLPIVLIEDGEAGPLAKLAGLLDLERRRSLHSALVRRTRDWAGDLGGREPVEATPGEIAEAISDEAAGVVVIRPALVRFGDRLADGLRDDLEHECGLVLGPTLAGGWYLLALLPVDAQLLEAAGDGGPSSAGNLLAAAARAGVETGLLGAERDLVREADLRAAQADPLVDPGIVQLLHG